MKNKKQFPSRRDFLRGISLAAPAIMAGPLLAGAKDSKGKRSAQDVGLSRKPGRLSCDLLVYGATSAGVIAAYTAKMYGLNVLLVEPGRHLGGMTSGGLGRTDTGGQDSYITGLSQEFYIRVGNTTRALAP